MTANNIGTQSTPPYMPYATFISALDGLKQHGIPRTGIIDKTVWDSQSGSVKGQLVIGFKFLGLIDDDRRVLPPLPALVSAASEERKQIIKKLVEQKYASILALDLLTVSQGQLEDAFRKFDITGSTLKCAVRFFVRACVELGIPIAKRFSEKTRTIGIRKKRPAVSGAKRQDHSSLAQNQNPHTPLSRTWEEKLLEKFPPFDPSWPDELKTQWFAGFSRLMGSKPGE